MEDFLVSWCIICMDIMKNKSLKTLYRPRYNLYGVYRDSGVGELCSDKMIEIQGHINPNGL